MLNCWGIAKNSGPSEIYIQFPGFFRAPSCWGPGIQSHFYPHCCMHKMFWQMHMQVCKHGTCCWKWAKAIEKTSKRVTEDDTVIRKRFLASNLLNKGEDLSGAIKYDP